MVSCRKSKGRSKQVNVIIAYTIEPDSDVNSLTYFEKEKEVLAADITESLVAATCSGQQYLRYYDDSSVQQLEQIQEQVQEFVEQLKANPEKPKEIWYNRPLNKRKIVEVFQ